MAYLNEFPHVEANKLNLDWLLEQYSTFDKRLQELHDHFDEAVATFETELESFKHDYEQEFANYKLEIEGEIGDFKSDVNNSISTFENTVNTALENFETSINSDFNEFKEDVNTEVATISDALEQVSENVVTYVSQHISQWTLETLSFEVTIPLTPNNETYTNITLPNIPISKKPVILGMSRETRSGGGPYINHFNEVYVNGSIYPQVETVWANDVWNVLIREKAVTGEQLTSRTYRVFYTVM